VKEEEQRCSTPATPAYAVVHKSRYAHDPRFGVFLWRSRRPKKCPDHYDAKFCIHGVTTVLWVLVGYSMCFSGSYGHGDIGGIIGNFDNVLLRGISPSMAYAGNSSIPHWSFLLSDDVRNNHPALITGAFANRVNFKAYLLFLVAWLLFVYFPPCI